MLKSHHNSLTIQVFPRIHLGLLAMSNSGYRVNGGLGFAIKHPSAIVQFNRATHFSLIDKRTVSFTATELKRIVALLARVTNIEDVNSLPLSISISGEMPSHYGFGSSTAIRLACIEGTLSVLDVAVKRESIVRLSGRGGTSGVGINTYFDGGFSFDVGRRGGDLEPSRFMEGSSSLPLTLIKARMPRWEIGVCIPNGLRPVSGTRERDFFQRNTHLASQQINKAVYVAVYGVCASVEEADFLTFTRALNDMQGTRWKHAEWGIHGDRLRATKALLIKVGALSVAMSSFGPSLIFLGTDVAEIIRRARAEGLTATLFTTNTHNRGRKVSYE
jgi:beta-ribofuranosylaminobenzene 5'-phosphate synthase